MKFGEKIAKLKKLKKMSQVELAEKLVSQEMRFPSMNGGT